MSKFDYMPFTGGYYTEFVFHGKKYTESEARELAIREFGDMGYEAEKYTLEKRHCKYFVRVPEYCSYESDGGCYTYCDEGVRGSFPVIVFKRKEQEK